MSASLLPGLSLDDVRTLLWATAEGVLDLPPGSLRDDDAARLIETDSLMVIQILIELEERWGAEVPERIVERMGNGMCLDSLDDVLYLFAA